MSKPLAMIHNYIWGPSMFQNTHGKKWIITFVDDHTRLCWAYLLKDQFDAEQIFKNFHSMIQN